MKKKGLIIATIVMVLVLAVSLTTATYAWFTANAQASVTSIGVGVTTDAKVMIGVSNTNAFTSGTATETLFQYGAVTYDANGATDKWSAGQQGLGTSIDTGLTMTSITKAVYPTTAASGDDPHALTIAASDAFDANKDKLWVKSAGNGNTLGVNTQYEFAYANNHVVSETKEPGDYLDVTFGVRAAKGNITRIGIVLGFDSANTVNLGMCAGFNYWYQIKGQVSGSGLQEFYSDSYTKTISTMTAPKNDWTDAAWVAGDGLSWTPAAGDSTHVITVAGTAGKTTPLDQTTIYEIRVIIFLNGWDSDCNNSAAAAGVATGSNIRIDFITEEKAD